MNQSAQLFSRARSVIPGGVNSPVRAFRNVDGDPFFVQSAKGAYITDADGRQLIDYIGTWGPAILGHAPQPVLDAVHAAVDRGLGYGIPAPAEVDMAEMITDMVPSVEKVRMVNSGTEATMSAIRLARGYTGRRKIIKFIGCYHGHVDSLLVAAGSGALTFGEPDSAVVPLGADLYDRDEHQSMSCTSVTAPARAAVADISRTARAGTNFMARSSIIEWRRV